MSGLRFYQKHLLGQRLLVPQATSHLRYLEQLLITFVYYLLLSILLPQEVTSNAVASSKAIDAKDLKERRLKARNENISCKEKLLKYGDVADSSSEEEED